MPSRNSVTVSPTSNVLDPAMASGTMTKNSSKHDVTTYVIMTRDLTILNFNIEHSFNSLVFGAKKRVFFIKFEL